MASLDYIAVPSSATRITSSPSIERAKKIVTSLPTPTPSSTPTTPSIASSLPSNITSPTAAAFALLPQILLSSSIPSSDGTPEKPKPRAANVPVLLTTRDPLSIPTTSANFKRFVPRVGPVFWMQDRVEEVVMWRRGWRVTGVWIAVYAFLCYFPRMIFLVPHVALIAIILATYPSGPPTPSSQTAEWQANLQGIQNLMGFVADSYDLLQPHTQHLMLSPSHFTSTSTASGPPSSPYPPYILLGLLLSFPPLLLMLASPLFPARLVCLVGGIAPLVCTHPRVRPLLLPLARLTGQAAIEWALALRKKWTGRDDVPMQTIVERLLDDDKLDDKCWRAEMREVELWENERWGPTTNVEGASQPAGTPDVNASPRSSTDSDSPAQNATWSKANLRPGERRAWTRGRDGWGGIRGRTSSTGMSRDGSGAEGEKGGADGGEVSSNLTFSLAPGWAFVPTEGWRKDRVAAWCGFQLAGDSDGWVYTTDTWSDPKPAPVPGSVTRRRRWVRRVWFDGGGGQAISKG